jgi:hypothetical protein
MFFYELFVPHKHELSIYLLIWCVLFFVSLFELSERTLVMTIIPQELADEETENQQQK